MNVSGLTAAVAFAWILLGAVGCTADIAGDGGGASAAGSAGSTGVGAGGSASGGSSAALGGPGRVVMHRLNRAEYDNTVRDLLETEQRLSENFPPDDTAYGFDNVAS